MTDVLKADNLHVHFPVRKGLLDTFLNKNEMKIRAVDGIDLSVSKGEILSIVGESGCGKTTTGKALLRLVDKDYMHGQVLFEGKDICQLNHSGMLDFRRRAQMIFQDPYQSLNPKDSICDIVAEPLRIHGMSKDENTIRQKVSEALEEAGLRPASMYMDRYPHELSGGQRQRVAIAGALVLSPDFIVADEPVSMLDVSVRTGILHLLMELREKHGMAYVFITHDLSLAWLISDRIAIMYLGKIVETGNAEEVIANPLHPYAQALIEVMPKPEPRRGKKRAVLSGEPPDPARIPSGCRFHPRCPMAADICKESEPKMQDTGGGHLAACHFIKV